MKWVLLFFCAIFALFLFIILLLSLSTLRLNVKKLNISNFENGTKLDNFKKEIVIFFELYLFGKVPILKINIDKNSYSKMNIENNITKDINNLKNLRIFDNIKNLEFKEAKFDLQLGTEEVMATVFAITFISTILSIIFINSDRKKVNYKVMPLYQFGNSVNLHFNCIISVKMVHIIHIIIQLIKEGKVIKNERTSNRRSYDYSYE